MSKVAFNTYNSENKSSPLISEYSLNVRKVSRLRQYIFSSSSSKVFIMFKSNKKPKIFSYSLNYSNLVSMEVIEWSIIYLKYSTSKDFLAEWIISSSLFSSNYFFLRIIRLSRNVGSIFISLAIFIVEFIADSNPFSL